MPSKEFYSTKDAKTFSERIHKESLQFIIFPKGSIEEGILAKRMIAGLLGERIPGDHLPIVPISPKRAYMRDLFRKFFEVKESFRRLEMSKNFLIKIPTSSKISKLDYIRYHYEYYLNEIYISKLRINQLLDFLIRRSQKVSLSIEEINKMKAIKFAINDGTKGLIKTRGLHVHVKHYENGKLDQLGILHSLSKDFNIIRQYRDAELKELQKKIITEIKESHKNLNDFFEDTVYKHIKDIAFIKILPN